MDNNSKQSTIGFILIALIFVGFMIYTNHERAKYEAAVAEQQSLVEAEAALQPADTTSGAATQQSLAAGETAREPERRPADEFISEADSVEEVLIENDVLQVRFSTKGAQMVDVTLKEYTKYAPRESRNELVKLFDPESANFNMSMYLKHDLRNVKVSTSDYNFHLLPIESGEHSKVLTMRLPVVDGDDGRIDEAAATEMVDYALAHGINYFDTAWGYHNGTSETVVGKALSRHPRDSFYLADKFPGYDLSNMGKVEEIFEEQLRKCQVDHFDFYLIHNVCELNIDAYLDPKYGTLDYLREQRRNGRISHLGFSVHGNLGTMKRFLDAYGDDMEFCQVQLNYIDWEFQDAKAKVALLRDMGIPCWVMER